MTQHWSELVDQCLSKVSQKWPDPPKLIDKQEGKSLATGLIYSGNMHETVPKKLLLDNRLTPLERNAWLVFKLLLDKEGFAVPRYQDIQPFLTMAPYGDKASKETIARAIHILRLTRWLSLINKGRDITTGQIQGSLYILHDEPITAAEAIELDKSYIEFVFKCREHANKSVKIVALGAYDDIQNDQTITSHLMVLANRIQQQCLSSPAQMARHKSPSLETEPSLVRTKITPSSETEPSKKSLVRNEIIPSSETEPSLKDSNCNLVRKPNLYSTSTVYINTSTVLTHPLLTKMTKQQQANLTEVLSDLDLELINQVMQEFEQRCNDGGVNNPVSYLFGLLKKAKNNEFKPWRTDYKEKQLENTKQLTEQLPNFYCRDATKPIPNETKQQINYLKSLLSSKG